MFRKNKVKKIINNQQGLSSRVVVIIIVFVVMISSIELFIFNYYFTKNSLRNDTKINLIKKDKKFREVNNNILQSNDSVIYNLSGKMKDIDKDSFILILPNGDEKRIIITWKTKFNRLVFSPQKGTKRKTITEQEISYQDFKEGDYIEVISSLGFLVKEQEIKASQIRMLK